MRKYLRVIALFVATATTLGAAGCGPEVTGGKRIPLLLKLRRPRHRDGTGEESVPDDTILVDLVVDGFDAKSKERTWHSEGRVDTDLGQATTSDVPAAVRSLLEEFPSAPGATASR